MAVACLVFVSCGNQPKVAEEPAAEKECCATLTEEQQEMFANWDMWADLTEEQQVTLVADMKLFLDECKAKCEEKCAPKEDEEVCPEKAAKCEEFKAKWDAFETLALEDQKAMIDQVLECHKAKCCKEKEGEETCEKTCDKPCDKE